MEFLSSLAGGNSFEAKAENNTFETSGSGCFCCIGGNVDNRTVVVKNSLNNGEKPKKAGCFRKLCCCCGGSKKKKQKVTVGEYEEWLRENAGKGGEAQIKTATSGMLSDDYLTVGSMRSIQATLKAIATQQQELQLAVKQLTYQNGIENAEPLSDFSGKMDLISIAQHSIDVQVKKSDGTPEPFSGRVIKFTLRNKVPTVEKLTANQELEIIGAVKKHIITQKLKTITTAEIHDLVVRQLKTMDIKLQKPEWHYAAEKKSQLQMPVNLPRRGSLDDLNAEEFRYLINARNYYNSKI